MSTNVLQIATAVAPVFATSLGIGVYQAAGLGFPPDLAFDAWPRWLVFCALVYAFMAAQRQAITWLHRRKASPTAQPRPLP